MDVDGLTLRCPLCGYDLVQERGGTRTLKAATIRLDPSGPVAVCPVKGCRGVVSVPWLAYTKTPDLTGFRFVVKKDLLKRGKLIS